MLLCLVGVGVVFGCHCCYCVWLSLMLLCLVVIVVLGCCWFILICLSSTVLESLSLHN